MEQILEARNLTKDYGQVKALDNVNFVVSEGVTGLLGPNGAGKSTAMRLFLGLITPTSGSVSILGRPAGEAAARARIGYMPEHECLPSNISAADFLTHMAEVSGLPHKVAKSRSADALRHIGVDEERYRPIKDYSLGMRQRIKLAQALVHDPVLIMLDEPTAGLDPNGRVQMLELLSKVRKEFGINILITSHLLADVEKTCDDVILIENGRVSRHEKLKALTETSETLSIQVSENLDEFLSALKRMGVEAHSEALHTVMVPNASGEVLDMVRDALADASAPVVRMSPRRHALQEIFSKDGDKEKVA